MGARPAVFVVLVGLCLLAASPTRADLWYENYDKANEAMRLGDWAAAVDLLEQALAQNGESGARVRTYGMNFVPYFPYLKLGIARYNLGEYDAALLALEAEERLGAIQDSAADFDELQNYRRLAQEAKTVDEAGQRESAVAEILADAAALESRGDLDAAITALGRAQALDPDNADVGQAIGKIRTGIARLQEQQDLDRRVNDLVTDGKTKLAEGDFREAAAAFARANSLQPSSEIQALLDDAQQQFGAELTAQQDEEKRRLTISDGISRARQLEQQADYVGALDSLQAVLALDPTHSEAAQLQQSLLRAQADSESATSLQERLRTMLVTAVDQFDAGDVDGSYVTVNQVLSIDPGNIEAQRQMAAIYQEFGRQRLSPEALARFPPLTRVSDRQETQLTAHFAQRWRGRWPMYANGLRVEWVRSSEFLFNLDVLALADGRLRVYRCPKLDNEDWKMPVKELCSNVGDEDVVHDEEWSVSARGSENTEGSFLRKAFKVRHRLPVGLTLFRIEATNNGGLPGRALYSVYYQRPMIQSPWLYVALTLGMGAVAGSYYGRRWYRRRELFKRRFNPYIAGAPVLKDDLFFGRERLLSRVLQTVHNNSILLYGERRIGKTSFQHHLRRRLKQLKDPDYEFYAVFTDIQGTPQEKFFATIAEDIFEQLGPELDGQEPNPSLHDGTGYDYKEFVRDIRNVLKTLNSKNEKRVKLALLIDEIDELNQYDPKVNQRLRALFMRSFAEDLVAVVSGVGIKKHWESEGSPWYNFFEEIRVEPFRKEDAEELIQRPINGIFTLESGAVDRIITLAECKPYLIQKLCVSLVNRMHDEQRRHITVADVDATSQSKEA